MFTFISTCLKCVTIFLPLLLRLWLWTERDAINVGNVQTDITKARASQEFTCQPVHINGLIKNTDFLQDTEKLIKILFSRLNKLSITTYLHKSRICVLYYIIIYICFHQAITEEKLCQKTILYLICPACLDYICCPYWIISDFQG